MVSACFLFFLATVSHTLFSPVYLDVEWELAQYGVVETELEENPRSTVPERVFIQLRKSTTPTAQTA